MNFFNKMTANLVKLKFVHETRFLGVKGGE